MSHVSVASRLALVALLVTLVSLAITAAVGLYRGSELADELIETRLESVAASRSSEISLYLGSVRREVGALAASPGALDAIGRLGEAYRELDRESASSREVTELTEHYLTEIVPSLRDARGENVGVSFLVPDSAASVRLQLAYTVPAGPGSGGTPLDPSLVADAGDGSAYSAEHALLHPVYAEIAARSGYDDLLLIDAASQTVVYSYRKRIDFATSLAAGPHSGSSLSTLIERLPRGPARSTSVADFALYAPALDRPTLFVASPVLASDGRVAGYLAVSLSTAPFDAIVSGRGAWVGVGDEGKVYLAGPDATMRSSARWLDAGATPGSRPTLSDDVMRRVRITGTTALVQGVDRRLVEAAASGAGTAGSTDAAGRSVRSAFEPVLVDPDSGLTWTVIAEVPDDVLDEPVRDYAHTMLFAVALFVVAVTFVSVRWSNALIAPIRSIAARLRAVRTGVDEDVRPASDRPLPTRSPAEFVELSDSVDQMLVSLAERRVDAASRAAERAVLLRRFLPLPMAQRLEQSGEALVDHATRASVAVVVVEGLGAALARRGERALRELLEDVVAELDALAADCGLERVKVTGDGYYAVCGVSRPYLDHAARATSFALGARDLVAELAAHHGEALSVRVGVDSGPVAVGLTGGEGLVVDAWGPAVSGASELARHAVGGLVTVSGATRRQLPTEFVLAGDQGDDPAASAVVTTRVEHSQRPT